MEESSISSNGLVHGYDNHYIYSGNYMQDYQLGEHLWNVLTKEETKATHYNEEADVEAGIDVYLHNDFENIIVYEEAGMEIEDYCTNNDSRSNISDDGVVDAEIDDDDDVESYADKKFHIDDFQDMRADYSHVKVLDDSYIEVPHEKPTYYSYANATNPSDNVDGYVNRFYKATKKGDWYVMEKIGEAHPETLTGTNFHKQGTALHYTLWYGQDRVEIAKCLVKLMKLVTPKGFETTDQDGYTTLALAVHLHHDRDVLECIIDGNEYLLTFGASDRIPVVVASSKGFTDTTEFLYSSTPKKILSPCYVNSHDPLEDPTHGRVPGRVGINLLNQCISLNLFGIASKLLELHPGFLRRWDDHQIFPLHALAKALAAHKISNIQNKKSRDWKPSSDDRESICISEAYELLQFIIRVKDFEFDINNSEFIVEAMMEAAKHGIIEFITEMLKVDRELIGINKDGKNMFWYAIMNRQEKVFNLVYALDQKKDMMLSFNLDDKGNPAEKKSEETIPNILHFAAKCPSPSILDRISGPALQMQREVQWFKAVEDVTVHRYRQDLNGKGKTPYALFIEEHKELLAQGEKDMKETAKAASTVGALIVTTMFAASLAVVTAVYPVSETCDPHGVRAWFIFFLISAALSLFSCTVSIIVFLGILASRYSPQDFLSLLPQKVMIGFWALFVAVATMMAAFCVALHIMLKSQKLNPLIVGISLFSFVPVAGFAIYIRPMLFEICRSTCITVFDKSTRLPEPEKRKCCERC